MQVKVANRIYQMPRKEYDGILKVASEQVPFGIYGIEKKGYAELMNLKCESRTELKKRKRELKAAGYKVFSNG